MAADKLMEWKVLPRIMTIMFTIMAWRCAEWFMNLEEPTTQQSAFVSVIMGVMTGVYGIYLGKEARTPKE